MPRVVAISVFHNRAPLVERTLNSICAQTYQDFEAIIVDDGSADQTHAVIERYRGTRIRAVRHANIGFTDSLIKAINLSDSEYIAIVGSGDIAYPGRFAEQASFLDANTDVSVVGVRYETVNETSGRFSVSRLSLGSDPYSTLLKESIYGHSEVMFRRSIYAKVGGYRPFFRMSQDNDLWLRMGQAGCLALIPKVLHRIYKLRESITVTPDTKIMARTYRAFAVYCAQERIRGRPDPLDRYGPGSALFRPRSKILARRLSEDALRSLMRGRREEARLFIEHVIAEGALLDGVVLSGLSYIPAIGFARKSYHIIRRWAGSVAMTESTSQVQ